MLRQLGKKATSIANKLCPPIELDDFEQDEKDLIVGYQSCFVMIWTGVQVGLFLLFLSLFMRSGESNYFMRRKDCCDATELKFTDAGVPLEACSQTTCPLYEFTWDGTWDFFDDRPRKPEDGKYSKLYTVESENTQVMLLFFKISLNVYMYTRIRLN